MDCVKQYLMILILCVVFFSKAANSVSNKDEIRSKIGLTFTMDVPLVELTILVHHFILEKKMPSVLFFRIISNVHVHTYNISFQWHRPFRKYTQKTISWRGILMIWYFNENNGNSKHVNICACIHDIWYCVTNRLDNGAQMIFCHFFRIFNRNEISAID